MRALTPPHCSLLAPHQAGGVLRRLYPGLIMPGSKVEEYFKVGAAHKAWRWFGRYCERR